jgi:cytochrome b subunit of formate dehydrogenase
VPFERFLHFLVVTSFLLLVVTGMPLKFYYTGWAKFIFSVIGGPETARTLHRFGAIITFLYFGLHLTSLVGKAGRAAGKSLRDPGHRPAPKSSGCGSAVRPRLDGADDAGLARFGGAQQMVLRQRPQAAVRPLDVLGEIRLLRRVLGRGHHRRLGLIMWFPEFFTRFLPGWIINIALILHSDEALLAAGFIFSIHFFNTHFRIEKFPMDTVIFSGRVSKTEMLHERKRWYDRLVATGQTGRIPRQGRMVPLEEHRRSFGYFFFGLGLVLLALIIYAMATRLTH